MEIEGMKYIMDISEEEAFCLLLSCSPDSFGFRAIVGPDDVWSYMTSGKIPDMEGNTDGRTEKGIDQQQSC